MDNVLMFIAIPALILSLMTLIKSNTPIKKDLEELKKDLEEEKSNKKDKPCEIESLNKTLKEYKILFDAKMGYITDSVDKKFSPDTITYNRYHELIDDTKTAFYEELEAANKIWDLNILINENDINSIYEKKTEIIEKILDKVEKLMIEFIKSENSSQIHDWGELLQEIEISSKNIDKYIDELNAFGG